MKRYLYIILVMGVCIFSGCKENKEIEEKKIVRMVKYEEASKLGSDTKIRVAGSLKSEVESKLSFKVSGTIEKINVKIGDKVKKGQLLAELDRSDYMLQVQQAEAAIEQAKANILQLDSGIAQANSGIVQADSGILQAKAAIERANANYDQVLSIRNNARQDFERYKELFLNDNVAQNVYDKAKAGLEQAEASLTQTKAAQEQAEAGYKQSIAGKNQANAILAQSKAAKRAAEASLTALEKQLELSKLQLSYTRLVAPVDGRIVLRLREENENISAGMPIFQVDSGKQFEAEVYVSEGVINKLEVGDIAEIYINSLSETVKGEINKLSGSSTGFGGTYAVRIIIEQENPRLKSGMAVDVMLGLNSEMNPITLLYLRKIWVSLLL
jgi:multidrug resistance efflux pump